MVDPEQIGSHYIHSAGLHLRQLFLPFLSLSARKMILPHNADIRLMISNNIAAVNFYTFPVFIFFTKAQMTLSDLRSLILFKLIFHNATLPRIGSAVVMLRHHYTICSVKNLAAFPI